MDSGDYRTRWVFKKENLLEVQEGIFPQILLITSKASAGLKWYKR